ncbi:MAG: pyridoxamine 5'-phosphate oxidase, partial [Pseudonocardiales bacterium]
MGLTPTADLVGPDPPGSRSGAEGIRVLLCDIFVAAGGLHDGWPTHDGGTLEQRRTAALLT